MATKLSDSEAKLTALADQLNKGIDEVVAEVTALKDALANTEIPQTAQDSLDRLSTLVQKLDDLNPYAPKPTVLRLVPHSWGYELGQFTER